MGEFHAGAHDACRCVQGLKLQPRRHAAAYLCRHVLNPLPETRNPRTENKDPKLKTRDPEFETRNTKPETWNPKPETRNPKPETWNPKPETRNPKPKTLGAGSRTSTRQTSSAAPSSTCPVRLPKPRDLRPFFIVEETANKKMGLLQ